MDSNKIELLKNDISDKLSQNPVLSHNIKYNEKQTQMTIEINNSNSNYKIILNFRHNYEINGIDFTNKCKLESVSQIYNSTQSTIIIDTQPFSNFALGDIISYNGLSIDATTDRIIKLIKLLN